MAKSNPTLRKLVDLDETMNNVLTKLSDDRKIPAKRLMELFIIKGMLEHDGITKEERESLLDRQAKLMEKKQWLYK